MPKEYYAETILSAKSVLAMIQPLSSESHFPGKVEKLSEKLQTQAVILMPYQEASIPLGQQINQILVKSSTPEVILPQIAEVLGEAFQVDCCLITIQDSNSTLPQTVAWYSLSGSLAPLPQGQVCLLNQLTLSSRANALNILVINDTQVGETSFPEWPLAPTIKAVLGISTQSQAKINGTIHLICSEPRQWSQSEIERVRYIAEPVAIAITQVTQTALITSLQQQVKTSAQYQLLSNRLTIASRSLSDLDQIFSLTLASTGEAFGVERGLILMLKYTDPLFKNRERRESIAKAKVTVVCEWYGNRQQHSSLLNQSFWVSECSLCQQALTTPPQPVVIHDQQIILATDLTRNAAPLFQLPLLSALVLFPLVSQSTVLGFLVLQHSSPRIFTSEELGLLELVSAQVSNAIIHHQTLRQVQSLVEERTAQLQRSLEVQAKLYETTRRQVDQLRQLNQLKDDFVSTISHELKTPLTSITVAIHMLRQSGLPMDRRTKYLDILEQQCHQEVSLINDLLKLQELESHQVSLNLETIDLKPLLQELAQAFEKKWADKGLKMTLNLPKAPLLVESDSDSIERILKELLTNAGKYSHPDTHVILKATYQVNQQVNQIVLSLTNFGLGISPTDIGFIFDKFHRGQGVTQRAIQGTGLGLALVKSLVQYLNGSIDVSDHPSSNGAMSETCFTVTLPQSFDHAKP